MSWRIIKVLLLYRLNECNWEIHTVFFLQGDDLWFTGSSRLLHWCAIRTFLVRLYKHQRNVIVTYINKPTIIISSKHYRRSSLYWKSGAMECFSNTHIPHVQPGFTCKSFRTHYNCRKSASTVLRISHTVGLVTWMASACKKHTFNNSKTYARPVLTLINSECISSQISK